jgi:hypothetical protein
MHHSTAGDIMLQPVPQGHAMARIAASDTLPTSSAPFRPFIRSQLFPCVPSQHLSRTAAPQAFQATPSR